MCSVGAAVPRNSRPKVLASTLKLLGHGRAPMIRYRHLYDAARDRFRDHLDETFSAG
jgi:hypothetical protein